MQASAEPKLLSYILQLIGTLKLELNMYIFSQHKA